MSQGGGRASSGSRFEEAIGFSRAARRGRIVAVSGTAPVSTGGGTAGAGDAGAQARRCLRIIEAALGELGGGLSDVIRTRVFLVRREDWQTVAQVHGEVFGAIRPASTFVVVAGLLDPEWLVEIEADAVLEGEEG
jgi:enamine deaminase RidA (YjgF/YER057c/UK114 family)